MTDTTKQGRFIGTFGSGQTHSNKYVEVFAVSAQQAQSRMNETFGNSWANLYCPSFNLIGEWFDDAEDKAGVAQFALQKLDTIR